MNSVVFQQLVENIGVEPMTSWMQIKRSSQTELIPLIYGSPGQSWTADPYIISVVL